ncbi:GNAT family N-acetyltransferase [Mycoplasma sp. P36-A1]|uniref:GNAT family N-acetyltransferase n=1 Tax=Mycoplasma sp. P36-A1 TaxID=3252900 RepID=UPI003C2AEFFF
MIRKATREDYSTLKDIWYECFLEHDTKQSIDYYFDNAFDFDHTLVLEIASEIVCTLQLNQHLLCIDNEMINTSFIVGVATPIKHRKKGYMKQLMQYAINYAKNDLNQKIMILQAYNWDLYKPFGFKEEYYKSKLTLDKNFFSDFEQISIIENDPSSLLEIYQNYTLDLNGYKIRDEKYYHKMISMNQIDNIHYAMSKQAYIVYSVEEKQIVVNEAVFSTHYELFSLIKSILIKYDCNVVELHSDIFNFNYYKYEKELFMMIKVLDQSFEFKNNRLFISEWI